MTEKLLSKWNYFEWKHDLETNRSRMSIRRTSTVITVASWAIIQQDAQSPNAQRVRIETPLRNDLKMIRIILEEKDLATGSRQPLKMVEQLGVEAEKDRNREVIRTRLQHNNETGLGQGTDETVEVAHRDTKTLNVMFDSTRSLWRLFQPLPTLQQHRCKQCPEGAGRQRYSQHCEQQCSNCSIP